MNQISVRETQVKDCLELEAISQQLSSLLDKNPRKMEAFKTRMLKISLGFGLDKCTPESIINCGLQALTLDLPLEHGQGYIVNYGGKATFDAGYKGWQILAKRAGFSVMADVVYSCDEFSQDGFGFNSEMIFKQNLGLRKGANDVWAKANLTGVIVSVREDESDKTTTAFVPADMINKIVATSPSQKTDNAKKFSPHSNWAEQMFKAKAIKQVLSKFPIDLAVASQLADAIGIIDATEIAAQKQVAKDDRSYPDERFEEVYPKWKAIVQEGKKDAITILSDLAARFALTKSQSNKLRELKNFEPIEGEK